MTTITIANTKVSTFADLGAIPTADLLAYHNRVTGKDTKKFASRSKGLQQVWSLVEAELAQAAAVQPGPDAEANAAVRAVHGILDRQGAKTEPAGAEAAKATEPKGRPGHGVDADEGETSKAAKSSLKTRVDDLLAFLSAGPKTVSEIAAGLELPNEKKARSIIDAARRAGHEIICVGRKTFDLPADSEK